jgi:hypothetical protein
MERREYKITKVKLIIGADEVRMEIDNRSCGKRDLPYKKDDLESRTLDLLVSMLRDYRLREKEVDLLGEWLYRVLLEKTFGDDLHTRVADSSTFLRVELAFDDPNGEFARLPWEYVRRPKTKDLARPEPYSFSTHQQIALLRVPHSACTLLRVAEKPRILIVASSPTNLPQLLFEELTKKIIERIKSLDGEVHVLATPYRENPKVDGPGDESLKALDNFKGAATFSNFEEALNFNPHVVHFLGHGKTERDEGKIAFAQDNCKADWRAGEEIAKGLPSSVKLAFLQACESAKEANPKKYVPSWSDAYQALSSVAGQVVQKARIPAIVAMQAKVKNISGNDFAYAFYDALVQRQPIYRALQMAHAESKGPVECVPVLYLDTGGENDEGVLFPALDGPTPPSPKRPSSIGCPWCTKLVSVPEGTKPEALRYCTNPKCKSLLRCPNPNCEQPIGKVAPKQQESVCGFCGVTIRRGREQAATTEKQKGFTAVTPPFEDKPRVPEQHRSIKEEHVFRTPQELGTSAGGSGSNVTH